MALTEVEQLAAELLAKKEFSAALAVLSEHIYAAAVQENPALLSMPVSAEAVKRARALADHAARSLTEQLAQSELSAMGDTIARALEEGKRPRDIYAQLEEVKSLDRNRARQYEKYKRELEETGMSPQKIEQALQKEYDRLLTERRKTIAQTEGRDATSTARMASAESRGDKFKVWVTQSDDRVSDVCAGNEAAGVIPIAQAFPSGHQHTPGHPNCRCTVAYLPDNERALKIAERRQNEYIEQTKQQREKEKEDA
jgi:hypothetical protein